MYNEISAGVQYMFLQFNFLYFPFSLYIPATYVQKIFFIVKWIIVIFLVTHKRTSLYTLGYEAIKDLGFLDNYSKTFSEQIQYRIQRKSEVYRLNKVTWKQEYVWTT